MVGLQSDQQAYLWVSDAEATWWKQVVEKQTPESREMAFSIAGLADGRYEVQWWNTLDGARIKTETLNHSGPLLRLKTPLFAGDIAAKIRSLP